MKEIMIADTTLCADEGFFGFKEKLEIARQLDKLCVDVIELPEITNAKADSLFVRTVASFVKNSKISVAAGSNKDSVANAISALSTAKNARIRIELPVSPVGMEYIAKKKADPMLAWINEAVRLAKKSVADVEFCAVDATRAEPEFLLSAIQSALDAGASMITLCDSAAEMLPDDFALFVQNFADTVSVPVAVRCDNGNGMAAAASILAVRSGASCIKTDVTGMFAPMADVASMLKNCGNRYSYSARINQTELFRILKQISWIATNAKNERSAMTVASSEEAGTYLSESDDQATVISFVSKLGYDLSEEDQKRVYEEFLRVAAKKSFGSKELDAIVASVALQVPATFKLASYVINNGNIISASAQISLEKGESILQGVCIGDGPVDASFQAIDQIIGHHYELDDFQIQSVTRGKEAMAESIVKLRSEGKLYSGKGTSTDIVGASINAYINALNKICFEEEI